MKLLKNCLLLVVLGCLSISCEKDDNKEYDYQLKRIKEVYINGTLNYTIDYDDKGLISVVHYYSFGENYVDYVCIRDNSVIKKVETYSIIDGVRTKYNERSYIFENGYYLCNQGNIPKFYANPETMLQREGNYFTIDWENMHFYDILVSQTVLTDKVYYKHSFFDGIQSLSPDFLIITFSYLKEFTNSDFKYLQHLTVNKVPLKGRGFQFAYLDPMLGLPYMCLPGEYFYSVEHNPKINRIKYAYTFYPDDEKYFSDKKEIVLLYK